MAANSTRPMGTRIRSASRGIRVSPAWLALKCQPAYLVAEVEVTDPAAFEAYVEKAMESLKPYNARVISNSRPDVKEGAPAQSHVIILAFDSMADAQKWYGSPPYKELIPERQKAARTRLYLIEGTPS